MPGQHVSKSLHVLAHWPQLFLSLASFTQAPLQIDSPVAVLQPHVRLSCEQGLSGGHTLPQVPQLLFVLFLTQVPLQQILPAAHALLLQLVPHGPDSPVCFLPVFRLTHSPPQQVGKSGFEQTLLQAPQLSAFVCVLAQAKPAVPSGFVMGQH